MEEADSDRFTGKLRFLEDNLGGNQRGAARSLAHVPGQMPGVGFRNLTRDVERAGKTFGTLCPKARSW